MVKQFCPVCRKTAGSGTFKCVNCEVESWVHPKCGGYSSAEIKEAAKSEALKNNLSCNNCKKVNFSYFL